MSAAVVDQEMDAIIYYLTAFAHIDGSFDKRERDFIEQFITRLVAYRVRVAFAYLDQKKRDEETARWTAHFRELFAKIESEIGELFTESVAEGEDTKDFVFSKLKLRCYELFKRFPKTNQEKLLELADELMQADDEVHANEERFHAELKSLLAEDDDLTEEDVRSIAPNGVSLSDPRPLVSRVDNYDIFAGFERNWATTKEGFAEQIQSDLLVLDRAKETWDAQRATGNGKLAGIQDVRELTGQDPFLDRHVYVLPPKPNQSYELLVLGDLHGCYSCLKAALLQSDFFAKVEAHHFDPTRPAMKLVLLGDYIDRGKYSYDGILRTVLQLFLIAPDHVYVLRGNHEYYVELNGRVYGGVRPAEAINSLTGIASEDVFRAYKKLFEAMPNMLLFGRTLFVHAGIPRDDTLAQKWMGLETLNDDELRFQMLWSDPSEADHIPLDLQKSNARFPFGKRQFKSFMQRLGCTAMVRGHERVVEGVKKVYSDADAMLISLFSSGGSENRDLPEASNYREVTPMALSVKHDKGVTTMTPFALDWKKYNRPDLNAFLQDQLRAG